MSIWIWRALSEVFVERESCGWGCGLTPSLDACIEENGAFWSCSFYFNAIQRGIETAAVAARWAAKPLIPPLLSSHTPSFVAFRFYLAALRAHDLIDATKKGTSYEGGFEWGVDGPLSM